MMSYILEIISLSILLLTKHERIKLKLRKIYEFNRDDYTNSKTDFIQKYTLKAKLEYKDRY